ncbi:hypothetical protein [Ureibacillus chungkukjangi]|uniref:Uncharacterized protein n=1 Tax=Ureibacillus chungkukjangi TaxID=1202712 RepID=A0A318U207_9BACL|nr:hypothetical protein [Ureibacillus chungkukjangi]PYF08415.1 hypothetical protein BJ095_102181 [Ureibacillus chungkukjangi]
MKKKLTLKEILSFCIIAIVAIAASSYFILFFKPKNSLELYQSISFAKDFEEAQKLSLTGYERNFKKEDFDYISKPETVAKSVNQFTLFEFEDRTYLILTSPGKSKLKVLAVEELPEEIRSYFLEFSDSIDE